MKSRASADHLDHADLSSTLDRHKVTCQRRASILHASSRTSGSPEKVHDSMSDACPRIRSRYLRTDGTVYSSCSCYRLPDQGNGNVKNLGSRLPFPRRNVIVRGASGSNFTLRAGRGLAGCPRRTCEPLRTGRSLRSLSTPRTTHAQEHQDEQEPDEPMMVVIVVYRDRPTALAPVVAPDRIRDDHDCHSKKYHG